jgi:anti-anti-sigma factor
VSSHERLEVEIDVAGADEGVSVVELTGEIDLSTAPRLRAELQAVIFTSAPKELVLDLEGVSFIDSSGVRVLIEAQRSQRDRDASLILENVPESARLVLEVSGLTQEFRLQ